MQDLAENGEQSHPFWLRSKHQLIRHHHTWIKRPPEQKFSRNKAEPHTSNKWAPRAAHGAKEKVGGPSGRPAALQASRPTHGPHRLKPSTWQLLIGWGSRFQEARAQLPDEQGVAPHYIYEGRGSISSITKHPSNKVTLSRCSSSSLVEVLGLEEFRFES